jgi:cytochrome d ubiquinol oxidase subunit II
VPILAALAALAAVWLIRAHRDGWAFVATGVAVLATVATIFVFLYPHVMVSSTSAANSLTITNASSSAYTLKVMTVVTAIFFPIVLIYQGWTFYVFRRRIGVGDLQHSGSGDATPGAGAAGSAGAPAGR